MSVSQQLSYLEDMCVGVEHRGAKPDANLPIHLMQTRIDHLYDEVAQIAASLSPHLSPTTSIPPPMTKDNMEVDVKSDDSEEI